MNKQKTQSLSTAKTIRIMNHKQVYEYFGGNIGRDKVYKLMKANVLRSTWLNGRLVSDADSVKKFADALFNNKIDGLIEATPISYIDEVLLKKTPVNL